MFGFRLPNYSPDDIGDVPGFGVEEDLAILKDGTDESPDDKQDDEADDKPETSDEENSEGDDDTEEENKDDEEDDNKEDEDDKDKEEEEEDEQDEIKITVKGIKKDFPDFFKKHPEMKGVIFRERQYSEIYSSPQEAQSAAKLANQFNAMEADLVSGDTEPLFKALKNVNEGKNFDSFLSNLLPNLRKVDKEAYYKVAAVPLKQALRTAFKHGQKEDNKNLTNSALWLHKFLFESDDIEGKAEFEDKVKSAEVTPAEKEYREKIEALNRRDRQNFKVSIDDEFTKGVEKFFMDGLDPDNILSEKTKTWMLRDLFDELNDQMVKDTRYMRGINSIWQQATGSGYNPSFKTRIVSTSLARAKQIIPSIRTKLRAEALGERRRLSKSKERERETPRVVSGRDNNKRVTSKKDTSQMTDLEIIRSS